ncbi:MAG: ATP synthase subunit I [Gemmatimonadota bacterium]
MNETLSLALASLAGLVLGGLFFGGLWWTIQRGVSSRYPASWFLGSVLARISITVAGFYFVAGARWERFLSCLAGFVIAHLAATWLQRPSAKSRGDSAQAARHAP